MQITLYYCLLMDLFISDIIIKHTMYLVRTAADKMYNNVVNMLI